MLIPDTRAAAILLDWLAAAGLRGEPRGHALIVTRTDGDALTDADRREIIALLAAHATLET